MHPRPWTSRRGRRRAAAAALALAIGASVSCGQTNSEGRSPSYLIIDSLTASSGASPGTFGNALESDVVTNNTVYEDLGKVLLKMALKDVGGSGAPTTPTATNAITVTRYHVDYKRSDGRKTQGVDVPYSFDGGATGTFAANGGLLSFILVRGQAKLEAPLKALRNNAGAIIISTVAEITFYGTDQNGNTVSVMGTISVNFADWGDPAA